MKKIAVAQKVSSRGLGAALQSYVIIRPLNDLIFESEITFIHPYLKDEFSVFKSLKLNTRLIDLSPAGHLALWRLLHSSILNKYKYRIERTQQNKYIKKGSE